MRSKFAVGTIAMATALATAATLAGPANAVEPVPLDLPAPKIVQEPTQLDPTTKAGAVQALKVAKRVNAAKAQPGDPSATLARRDLFLARPHLTGDAAEQADAIMARPFGDSNPVDARPTYSGKVKRKCNAKLCVVWTTSGADRTTKKWAKKTFRVMNQVWKKEVGKLGYRAPKRDGRLGGNGKLDIYLGELRSQGMYGYCQAEYYVKGQGRPASGYCALDNDFKGFSTPPKKALKATAAHEFFHAVQYSYDVLEHRWMMESTATWAEERVYDGVNDNRQYLRTSQLAAPWNSLLLYDRNRLEQYGNWIFWEYLTKRYGKGIVKNVWQKSAGKRQSVKSLKKVLKRKGGMNRVYADYAARLTIPRKGFPEGKKYRTVSPQTYTLGRGARSGGSITLPAYASYPLMLRPNSSVNKKTKLRLRQYGPRKKSNGLTVVVVTKKGKVSFKRAKLKKKGAFIKVKFNKKISRVYVPVTNAGSGTNRVAIAWKVK